MSTVIDHWVGGGRWSGDGIRTGPVHDPASGEQIAEVRFATAADVDAVVSAATEAAIGWRGCSLGRRSRILFAFRELIERFTGDLARVITTEHGKTLADASGEIRRGVEVVEFACGLQQLLKGEHSQQVSTGTDVWTLRQPLGVVAGITPFNFPAMVPMWMFPLAIACGNSFVLKPSERDPSASMLLAEWLAEAGLPDGVFSVVQGDREAVDALLLHPGVAAVSFVGSTPVARHVYGTAAAAAKRVQALGGAKNHMVVLPDADLEAAADAAVSAGYGSAGQRCMAVSVVVVVGEVADELVSLVADRTRGLVVGDGEDPDSDLGPLISAQQLSRVGDLVGSGVVEGAELVVDGRGIEVSGHPGGFWLGPCLFDRVDPSMRIYREEIFGPVLCVVRVASLEQALDLVNVNRWGNGAAIFTRDGASARRFEAEAEAGMVGVNVPIPVPVAAHSFGGWGSSLFGDTHVYGPEGVRFYTRAKVVTSRWAAPAPEGADLGFPA